MIDLEAIRARNERHKRPIIHMQKSTMRTSLESFVETTTADVDALLAEIERLSAASTCTDCFMERYYDASNVFCSQHAVEEGK